MTKKHFEAIAKILNENKTLVKRQRTNLARDRARFLAVVEEK